MSAWWDRHWVVCLSAWGALPVVWNFLISYWLARSGKLPGALDDWLGNHDDVRFFGSIGIGFWPIVLPCVVLWLVGMGVFVALPRGLADLAERREKHRLTLEQHVKDELRRTAEAEAAMAKQGPFRSPAERCAECGRPKL